MRLNLWLIVFAACFCAGVSGCHREPPAAPAKTPPRVLPIPPKFRDPAGLGGRPRVLNPTGVARKN
jgi:hypothetical protein